MQASVRVNAAAYARNLAVISARLPASTALCPVIKADAYGHGLDLAHAAVEAAEASSAAAGQGGGGAAIGVCENWEMDAVRERVEARHGRGAAKQRIKFFRLRPANADEAEAAIAGGHRVVETVGSLAAASAFAAVAERVRRPVVCHLMLDAGIGRTGFYLDEAAQAADVKAALSLGGLSWAGITTHLPVADDEDDAVTRRQIQGFLAAARRVRAMDGVAPEVAGLGVHFANSAATLRFPDLFGEATYVRPGVCTYGMHPSDHVRLWEGMEPVMSWTSRVALIRNVPPGATIGYGMTHTVGPEGAVIATVPVGYCDGFVRDYSNNADVLIGGKRCPLVGRVSMNMITVDVTAVAGNGLTEGAKVTLLGRDGSEEITAEELAARAGTINYEVTCLLGRIGARSREVTYS